jgi:UDP-N-acetylmuramate--alanine ligase
METAKQAIVVPTRSASSFKNVRVHLIGVGGSGMRALAAVLLARGASVTGSDAAAGGAIDRLIADGAKISIGQRAENLPARCDIVVYSAAINDANPELLAARQRGLEVIKYSQMLGRLMAQRVGIAVAGTHGKSSTTGMVAYVLRQAGLDPSFVVGATVEQLGGPSGVGEGKHFVAEACEYDRSFLNLHPHLAAILNVDEDHLDCYDNLGAIIEAFRAFAANLAPGGLLVANGEDRNCMSALRGATCEVQTFGMSRDCTWQGANAVATDGQITMDVLLRGEPYCRLTCPMAGVHSAYNSLAATALLHCAGVSPRDIARILPTYKGVKRRSTLKGQGKGITVVDDYAHHPTEIQVTLRSLRDKYHPRRLVCVFQPHQHSRTRFLLRDFARSFGLANEVIVPDIYFVRDSDRERDCISAEDLVAQIRLNGGAAIYLKEFSDIASHLRSTLAEGDLLVTMGAGNVWEVADETVRWLGRDS